MTTAVHDNLDAKVNARLAAYDNRSPQHWLDNLAGKSVPISVGHPFPGFYKAKLSDGTFVAAFIEWHGDAMVCRVGNSMRDAQEYFHWLAKNPITEEMAMHWFSTGQWPGEDAGQGAESSTPHDGPPPKGHNNPPQESLLDQLRGAFGAARQWLYPKRTKEDDGPLRSIESKEECDFASVKVDKLMDLKRQVEAQRVAEKAPHLEAGKAIDKKYKPAIENTELLIAQVKRAMGAWMAREKDRLEAERAKAEEQRAAAREREPGEDDDAPAWDNGEGLPALPGTKVQVGGFTGRKFGLKEKEHGEIEDRKKLSARFGKRPRVIAAYEAALLEEAFDEWKKTGKDIPGLRIVKTPVAA